MKSIMPAIAIAFLFCSSAVLAGNQNIQEKGSASRKPAGNSGDFVCLPPEPHYEVATIVNRTCDRSKSISISTYNVRGLSTASEDKFVACCILK